MPQSRVLVADDENDFRLIFRFAFQQEGFAVCEAADGQEAVALLQSEEFDAVLLDIAMPKLDGVRVMQTYRQMGRSRCAPIIAVSALGDPALRRLACEAGAVAFLEKPLVPAEVVHVVRAHLA